MHPWVTFCTRRSSNIGIGFCRRSLRRPNVSGPGPRRQANLAFRNSIIAPIYSRHRFHPPAWQLRMERSSTLNGVLLFVPTPYRLPDRKWAIELGLVNPGTVPTCSNRLLKTLSLLRLICFLSGPRRQANLSVRTSIRANLALRWIGPEP